MAKKRRKKKSGTEFSKLIMVAVMATYFIGLFFAMAIILLMMVREGLLQMNILKMLICNSPILYDKTTEIDTSVC